jgi:segregation and condensation protein A
LLELIERAQLDITKVALAQVTDQYLTYLERAKSFELEEISSFLVIAARLLQIKSEALLPRPPERDPGEEDPGEALARQLVAYKKYKQIAVILSEREDLGLRTFTRGAPISAPDPQLDLGEFRPSDLRKALEELARIQNEPIAPLERAVARQVVRLRDRIMRIVESLRRLGRTTFRKAVEDAVTRLEIVVSFLGLLELMKQGQVEVDQSEPFAEIEIAASEEFKADQVLDFDLEFDE